MGLIHRINRTLPYATEPMRKFHPMERGYIEKAIELTNSLTQNAHRLEQQRMGFPARAILPPKTISLNYPIRNMDSLNPEGLESAVNEKYTVNFSPMTLDTWQMTDTYLKNLSAQVPKDSFFPDAVMQPEGINFENLDKRNQGYSNLLRDSPYAKKDILKQEISTLAEELLRIPARLNDEAMKRYKTYDDYHADDPHARYLSSAQAQLLVADHMRQLSEQSYKIAKKKGINQETRNAFSTLGNHFNAIKRHHVSQASAGLLKDDSEYKEAQARINPVVHKHKLTPGSDTQTRTTTGIKFGVKRGVTDALNAQVSVLPGTTVFGQKNTGRDLETSVVKMKGVSISLDGQVTTGAEVVTSRTFVNGTWALTGGTQFKAENEKDRNEGEFKLNELRRKNNFFKGAGPKARDWHAQWQRISNVFGKEMAGSPGKSPAQPFFVTAEKTGKGKFNEQEIIDSAVELDRYFGSDTDSSNTFEHLSKVHHSTIAERFRKIDEIGQDRDIKGSDIETHAPGMYYPSAISGMPANRYNNSKHVIAPARQSDLGITAGR